MRFLQGVLTCNLEPLKAADASLGALLTPQGKIICDFLIVRDDEDGFLIDMNRALCSDLVHRLKLYRLRAKIEIEDLSDHLAVFAFWGDELTLDDGLVFADPRPGALGWRAILPLAEAVSLVAQAGAHLVEADDYHGRRITAGIPEGGKDFALGDTFPHEANFDQLGGVDFAKGCYVGQEVVSRMHHRANVKKRIVPIVFDGPRPMSGVEVIAGEKTLGYTGSAVPQRGLALLRLDQVGDAMAEGKTITAGGIEVRLTKPDWATFDVPGTAS